MQQLKYFCDHCGKEITINNKGIAVNGYLEMHVNFANADRVTNLTDLCFDCVNELFDIVEKFISKAVE